MRRRSGWRLALIATCVWAGMAQAQEAASPADDPRAVRVTGPDWERKPRGDDVGRVYPMKAQRAEVMGVAVIRCAVDADGRLKDCAAISEAPKDYGFGDAALKLSTQFKMRPKLPDGTSVEGGIVTIPITFSFNGPLKKTLLPEVTWRAAPTVAAVKAAYPAAAQGVAGEAVVRCGFSNPGGTANCAVRSQSPEDKGFGPAALELAKAFRIDFQPGEEAMLSLAEADITVRFSSGGQAEASSSPPRWRRVLSPEAAVQLFPAQARAASVGEGVGRVDCAVTAAGQLTDCRVAGEAPADLGFGAAALQAATLMSLSPWGDDGRPFEGRRLIVPIRLKLDAVATASP